jgi:hypothetical protein
VSARKKETISRAFRLAYPEHAATAKAHDIRVGYSGKAFWAENDYQLTGFTTMIRDGVPHPATQADIERRIGEIFAAIIAGRAKNATMTPRERFARAVEGLSTIKPRYGMISSWGEPGGDSAAACGWRGAPTDFQVHLAGLGQVARAEAESIPAAIPALWDSFEKWEAAHDAA